MVSVHKYFLCIALVAGLTYAADEAGSTSSSAPKVQKQTTQEKKSVAKSTRTIRPPKTNWSKIKDLFM